MSSTIYGNETNKAKIYHKKKQYDISISSLPNNCDECPFFLHHKDDEYSGYDYNYCQFGAKNNFGIVLHRAPDCPLEGDKK